MYRRHVASLLVAVCLAIGFHGSAAAKPRHFVLVCDTETNGRLIMIQGEGFKNLGQAVSQCMSFWNGRVIAVER